MRTRTSEGYQQVELTAELTRRNGTSQQVISVVPCRRHMPFFTCIWLADLVLFASALTFAIYAHQYGGGLVPIYQSQRAAAASDLKIALLNQSSIAIGTNQVVESTNREPSHQAFNAHAMLMIVAFVYLNGQAMIAYKTNYLVKHKSVTMLFHFMLHLMVLAALSGGLYYAYNAQHDIQQSQNHGANSTRAPTHFYSAHSWTGLISVAMFLVQFLFGFITFIVTICCRKVTARFRARALPIHRMLAMLVLCSSTATVISGLTQLARLQLGLDYRDFTIASIMINATAVCVCASTILIVLITFLFKRRQAHDLPLVFKTILGVTQIVQLIVVLAVVEFLFQMVTPHVNQVINGQLFADNSTLSHFIGNATSTLSTFTNSVLASASSTLSGGNQPSPVANNVTSGSGVSLVDAVVTTAVSNITLT